jgi:hypothetical protein
MKRLLTLALLMLLLPQGTESQQRLVKILVTTPFVKDKSHLILGDVVTGCIIRDLKLYGGLEIIDREKSEQYLRSKKEDIWVSDRYQAHDIGEALGADIVIFSQLIKTYDTIVYWIGFLEVKKDLLQRVLNGSFRISDSPTEIGHVIKKETDKLKLYIPLPSEIEDPGIAIREKTVDPDSLPKFHAIEGFPESGSYGILERVLTYYRVFPEEKEYRKIEQGSSVMRFSLRDDLDEELTQRLNSYYVLGDFAIRHNMQAFIIENCSTTAINVLIANNIPVIYTNDLIIEYQELLSDGYCMFKTLSNKVYDSTELTHRDRSFILIILPKPGRRGGIPKEYLDSAVGRYKNEWNETPKLVKITEGLLDIEQTGDD